MNRKAFFDVIREPLFYGALAAHQVAGLDALLDTWDTLLERDTWPNVDARWAAYPLATAYHETGRTMIPVRERGLGAGHPYGVPDPGTGQTYYGRGHVQLTWRDNYARMEAKFGQPLLMNPDLALDMRLSAQILFTGMADGNFTGKRLSQFFKPDGTSDAVHARLIVNGMDRALEIAGYYEIFLAALDAAA